MNTARENITRNHRAIHNPMYGIVPSPDKLLRQHWKITKGHCRLSICRIRANNPTPVCTAHSAVTKGRKNNRNMQAKLIATQQRQITFVYKFYLQRLMCISASVLIFLYEAFYTSLLRWHAQSASGALAAIRFNQGHTQQKRTQTCLFSQGFVKFI